MVSAPERLPAKELLQDPFLQHNNLKEPDHVDSSNVIPEIMISHSKELPMEIDCDNKSVPRSFSTENTNTPYAPVLEFKRINGNNEFRLKGEKNDDNSISLILRIADSCGE